MTDPEELADPRLAPDSMTPADYRELMLDIAGRARVEAEAVGL